MKQRLLILFLFLFLVGCSVKEEAYDITVFQKPVSSIYTGQVKQKLPHGNGFAKLDTDSTIEGTFEKGIFMSGNANHVAYSFSYQDYNANGYYTGEVLDQMPTGAGTFESDTFSYEGSWSNGNPDGIGKAKIDSFLIPSDTETLTGTYEGAIEDGKAQGDGIFTYQENESEIEMKGSFSQNQFHGSFLKTIHYPTTTRSYPVYYENGTLIQNPATMIAYLEGMRYESYCVSDTQFSFLLENTSIFEGSQQNSNEINSSFDYTSFSEEDTPSLIRIENAEIKSIQRYKPYENADTVTSMIVSNVDGWYHLFFAYSVDTVDTGDVVDIIALPLCHRTLTSPEQDYPCIDGAGAYVVSNHAQ